MDAKQRAIQIAHNNLKELQRPSGLFVAASPAANSTGYEKAAWWRDNVYEAIGLEAVGDFDAVRQVYGALFEILNKHRTKLDWAVEHRPSFEYEYLHARYQPTSLEEFHEGWGNAQHDMIGVFLFKVAQLEQAGQLSIGEGERELLQLVVRYLESCRYWEDFDNGMWEENREVHSSSVGNCVAGLEAIGNRLVNVESHLVSLGRSALNALLPRESATKACDLAQLSLIWPCNVVSPAQRELILDQIEGKLVRSKGVARYEGDLYYNVGGEAEWVFGFSWLAKIYCDQADKYEHYLNLALAARNEQGQSPELYLATGEPNENTPLGWSESMLIVALSRS